MAAQGPAAEHREVIEGGGAGFLDRHRRGYGHPAGGLIARDTDGVVGGDARQLRDIGDVGLGVVLVRWCPFLDDGADGEQAVRVVIGAGEQPEGCTPTPFHRFKLAETCVCLLGTHALPLILASADIQRIIISDSSWCHNYQLYKCQVSGVNNWNNLHKI